MMTRKDFEAIAAALASTRPRGTKSPADPELLQWNRDRLALAIVFRQSNPRFSSTMFLQSSGGMEQ